MSGSDALEGFLEKWRARWPEWSVVEVFVPANQRRLALGWFALLQEFEDAMNIAGDPLPADAKLGWWAEELRDWSQRRSRHPLGRILEPHEAPWSVLAAALPSIADARSRALDEAAAFASVEPLARAVGEVEVALFRARAAPGHELAIAARLLASRVQEGGGQGVPVRLRDGLDPTLDAWAAELLRLWPARDCGPLPRRLLNALQRLRLGRSIGGAHRPAHRLHILWLGWRAARA